MAFVLDTGVVSELRKALPGPRVLTWFDSVDEAQLYSSVLVVGEIVQGVGRLRRRDPAQAAVYERFPSSTPCSRRRPESAGGRW
ncbi:MAG TPA: hypothetical protein VFZ77_04330 [Acidimicrobiales bacterium]